jgi:CMP-N,N'-diacetyllegionaminic acid synthase
MKLLVFIPARGGSKRLPGKNIKQLGGKPLINWSIEPALEVSEICDVLVSTDDQRIADIAIQCGALVPWLRPKELATDHAHVVDAALHALNWYESNRGKVDGLLMLQPTSPFRTVQTIQAGIQCFKACDMSPVVAVSQVSHGHPMWCMKIKEDVLEPFIDGHGLHTRSQDLAPAYTVNGCLYLISGKDLMKHRSFFPEATCPLVVSSQQEALDIDTMWDWDFAEYIFEKHKDNMLINMAHKNSVSVE